MNKIRISPAVKKDLVQTAYFYTILDQVFIRAAVKSLDALRTCPSPAVASIQGFPYRLAYRVYNQQIMVYQLVFAPKS